jgi:threonyl-tRNA synthetase
MDKSKEVDMDTFWHSASHLMTQAVLRIFKDQKIGLGVGMPIKDGFYQDYDIENLCENDLRRIEKEMKKIVKEALPITKKEVSKKEALKFYKDDPYKTELVNAIEGDTVTMFTQGEFDNLCKGPHVKNTSEIKAFKLLKISSAYWRGDEKNKQLTRIYGIAFPSNEEIKTWKEMRAKAESNSNIKLGKELDLYLISDNVGKGLPIWTPNGTMLRMQLQDFLVKEQQKRGYDFVMTPHIGKLELFKTSGHYQHYKEMMYAPIKIEEEEYLLKPMNCPFHIQYYMRGKKSYRDLPMRLSEMGTVYRYEKSGELSGLLRVRGFTQDDAHIFCTEKQVKDEFKGVFDLVTDVMTTLGLKEFRVRIGTRDPTSDKYVGSKENWDKSTKEIIEVLDEKKITYTIEEGDAAFYGPKADIVVNDALGREWQTGTIQLDYNLPERFDLNYIGADGKNHRPIMIHRAPFGSFERFVGIIIEHFGGAFPLWLSPKQAIIIPVSEHFAKYAKTVNDELIEEGIRSKLDDRNETLGYRIREAQKMKVPYIVVVGEKEVADKSVAVRNRAGKQEVLKTKKFLEKLQKEIKEKK